LPASAGREKVPVTHIKDGLNIRDAAFWGCRCRL
jgi:hypothetical protein